MWIRAYEEAQELGTVQLTPHLRPAEEEALLGCKAVDHRLWMRGQRALHRSISDRETAEVTNVLAQRELALHVRRCIDHSVRVELSYDFLSLSVIARRVVLGLSLIHISEPTRL